MDLIEALIRQLDELPATEAQIKVFTIVNGDATQLADLLRQLFGQATGTQGGGGNQGLQALLQTATGGGDQDYHKDEENRFAAGLAEQLRMRALAHDFEALIIIAPPRTLGELRKNLHVEVEKRIIMELAKEMTDRPIPDITAMLMTRNEAE